jgi:hypothetical protein
MLFIFKSLLLYRDSRNYRVLLTMNELPLDIKRILKEFRLSDILFVIN